MWYIIMAGYLFVTVLFSAAQPSLARALIYLLFWSVLPTLFVFWVARVRRRNRLAASARQRPQPQAEDAAE